MDNKDEYISYLTTLSGTIYSTEKLTWICNKLYAEAAKELFYNSSSKGLLTDPTGLAFLQKKCDEDYRQITETEQEIRHR